MNKLVVAVKQYWEEQGVSDIVLNNRAIGGEVNAIFLNLGRMGEKNQYTEAFKSFGKVEQLDLALYVLDKIESDVGSLPDHLKQELIELLSNNRPIPSIQEIKEKAEAYQRYVVVLEIIDDWNENMIGVGFSRTEDMNRAILGEFDYVLNERTGHPLTSDFKSYLGCLIEEGKRLPSFVDIEEMNTGLVGGV